MSAVRLAVLISGGGTTLLNLLAHIRDGRLDAEVTCVISSSANVSGVQRARDAGIEPEIVAWRGSEATAFSDRITRIVEDSGADLACLGGFLRLWTVPPTYEGRVMNIHPALLPSFGGRGMYGMHVHRAVVASGVKVSGCTVHFASNEYDTGPIIVQRTVPVHTDDTPEDVQRRVFVEECEAYPEAVRLYGAGRLRIDGRRVHVLAE